MISSSVSSDRPLFIDADLRLGIPGAGMARISTLVPLLGPAQVVLGMSSCRQSRLDAVLAWGLKPSGRHGERLAASRDLPLWRCEDGFLRSIGLGPDSAPLSLLVDDIGIYYDAHRPSRLEQLIREPLNQQQLNRAGQLGRLWRQERVSKYNGAAESTPPARPYVVVVDQTVGDLSIRHGMADAVSFRTMLQAALSNHPDCTILIKTHPDVVAGRKRGFLAAIPAADHRLQLCSDGGHPCALLEAAEAVYVVTSQLGFEALLWQRPVHCFGMPFYAGWGLTQDHLPPPERRRNAHPSFEQLLHAALIDYPRYLDPHSLRPCAPEVLIRSIGLQRRRRMEQPPEIEAFGFKPWKQPILRRYLPASRIRFRRRQARPSGTAGALVIWGREPGRGVSLRLQHSPTPQLLRCEDGFLRSVGLGANLIAPISWVLDRQGIYYDASTPSDLESLLAGHRFSQAERQRAASLRQRLLAAALTKYNLKAPVWSRPGGARRVVLVPGQVEGDASIRFGAPTIRTNLALLRAVRAAEPEAWLVYKPHPDVVCGLRQEGSALAELRPWCDELLLEGAMDQLYRQVDAVHVLTSLAGFEALLRGVEVHTWGLPFYAGWGLSADRLSCPRRGRQLQLDELVYGALIAYPLYVSRRSGLFIEPEQAVDELASWAREPSQPLGWWRTLFRHWGRWQERIAANIRKS